jgi:hypothetical protein
MLIETGDLTNAQAVDIVHTVGVVKVEVAEAAGESRSRMLESLALLARRKHSFQADAPCGPA